jgi:hypothetical protein
MQCSTCEALRSCSCTDARTREELWVEYQESPDNFWDLRASKTNSRAPDFKHKQTGESLWLTSAPSATFDPASAYTQSTGSGSPNNAAVAGSFASFLRSLIPSGLAIPASQWGPFSVSTALFKTDFFGTYESNKMRGCFKAIFEDSIKRMFADLSQLWEEYRAHPENFWDNRAKKFSPRAPDFKHKGSGKGLWVDSAPQWYQAESSSPPGGSGMLQSFLSFLSVIQCCFIHPQTAPW